MFNFLPELAECSRQRRLLIQFIQCHPDKMIGRVVDLQKIRPHIPADMGEDMAALQLTAHIDGLQAKASGSFQRLLQLQLSGNIGKLPQACQ